jgi:cytochrome c oxidase subunit 2
MHALNKTLWPMATLAATLGAGAARAEDLPIIGQPKSGLLGLQPAATNIADATHRLDNLLLWISIGIAGLVIVLTLWVIVRYNAKANPTPKRFTHNTPVELTWTLVPIVILMFIGANSLPVLFTQQEIPKGDVVIKVTGNQWYWSYQYEGEGFGFDAFMLDKDQLAANGYDKSLYKLATDNVVVVPTGKKIVMQVTGSDVIHSWTVPAFAVKQDAVPGRLAQLWFEVKPGMEGIYFGQCSELCGKNHAFMPIEVKAVTPAEYDAWLKTAKQKYADASVPGAGADDAASAVKLASAE